MFTKIMFALAIVFGAATGALAATKQYSTPSSEAQSVCGSYLGTDSAARVRFNDDCETVMQNQRWW